MTSTFTTEHQSTKLRGWEDTSSTVWCTAVAYEEISVWWWSDLSILSNVTMIELQIGLLCFYRWVVGSEDWGVKISRNIIGTWAPSPPPSSPSLLLPLPLSLQAGAFPQMLIVVNTAQYWVLRPASLPSICQTRARVSSLVSVGVSTHGEVSGFSPAGWVVGMVTPYQSQILLGFSWSTQESSGQSRASLWWRGDGRDDGKERDDGDDGPLTPHLGAPLLRFKWYHCWQAKWVNRLQT